jgi:predicted Zn-ribbon and HTH transcriptional regulator
MPDDSGNQTLRQGMIALLKAEECGVRDISQALHISEKEVADHLTHIRRSLSAGPQSLEIRPAECLACGFVFKDRRRFSRPGRCPRCRKTRISMPRFHIC